MLAARHLRTYDEIVYANYFDKVKNRDFLLKVIFLPSLQLTLFISMHNNKGIENNNAYGWKEKFHILTYMMDAIYSNGLATDWSW